MKPKFIAIAAMASNRVIGNKGKLPWHLPEDLKFFKNTTKGHPVLMGSKTFDSIIETIGKPLPNRLNIIITRDPLKFYHIQNIIVVKSLEQVDEITFNGTIFVIGGGVVYEQMLPYCDELLLTYVYGEFEGDTWFPEFEDQFELKEVTGKTDRCEFRRYVRI